MPADPSARRTVATYLIGLVDEHRLLSRDDLRRALSPTFHNVRAVIALLVSEGLLAESDGGYRVQSTTRPARRAPASRRRDRTGRG